MSTRPLRINFVLNLLSPMTRIAVALVTVPIYLRHIGDARFGVMSIVWILLGVFGFLDLGLSRAVTNALAKLRDAPQPERARVLFTSIGLVSGIGVVGGVALYLLGGFLLEHVISVPDALRPEISGSLVWISALLPLTLIASAGAGALESGERFVLVNAFQIVGMSLSQIAPVIVAVAVSPSLKIIIPTAAVAQGSMAIALIGVVYRLEGPFSFRTLDWGEARKLLGYGSWMFATNVVNPLLASADQFLIGSLMGVAAVAHYSVPMNLVMRSGAIPVAFGRTFFPRMSSLPKDAAYALGVRALSTMGYGFVAVCAPAVILSPIFFRYWIGADFALVAAPVAQTLFPGMWMSGLSFVAFTLMQSQGRADLTGKLHIAEFLPFLALLWILTSTFGIIGAAAAWTLRCTVDALAMFWASGMRRRDLAQLSPPAALLLATLVLSRFLGSHLVPDFLFAVLAALASLALAYFFSEDWAALMVGVSGRARVFIGGLTSRAKPIPPINTNAQK
jgi:O-antigen/teichoic acid export membrane protein